MSKSKPSELNQAFLANEDDRSPTFVKSSQRSCTDTIFILIFLLFWAGMAAIASVSVKQGDLRRIEYGIDSSSNLCGTGAAAGRSQLFWYCPENPKETICVEKCPTDDGHLVMDYNNKTLSCSGGSAKTYPTQAVLHRCLPSKVKAAMQEQLNSDTFADFMQTLKQAWKVIAIAVAVAFLLSFGWMLVLRIFANSIIWLSLTAAFAALSFLTLLACMRANWANLGSLEADIPQAAKDLDFVEQGSQASKILAACLIVADVLYLVLVCLMRRQLAIAGGIIKEASRCTMQIPSIIFYPVFSFIAVLVVFVYWGVVAVYLASAGRQEDGHFAFNKELRYAAAYHTFGLLWTVTLVLHMGTMTLAGTFSKWYFASADKKTRLSSPVMSSLCTAVRYHLGSAMLGSLVIAVVRVLRVLMDTAVKRLPKEGNNGMVKVAACCARCCLYLLEKSINTVGHNAYILIAIHGYSFCEGSKKAFGLITRNPWGIGAVNIAGGLVTLLGKLFITCATTGVTLLILNNGSQLGVPALASPLVPLVVVAVLSFFVASSFMGVFSDGMDAIFLCFLQDAEDNNGADRPYHADPELMAYMEKHKK